MQISRPVAIAVSIVAAILFAVAGYFVWQVTSPPSDPVAVDGVSVGSTAAPSADLGAPAPAPSASASVPGEIVPVPLPESGVCRSALDDVVVIVEGNPQVLQMPQEALDVFSERLGYAREACTREFGPQVSEGILRQFHTEVLESWLAGGSSPTS